MKILAILFGIVLTILAIINFTAAGRILPIIFGLLAILFGLLQGRWAHNYPLYGTLMMAILALLTSLRGVIDLFRLLSGGETMLPPQAITSQAVIAGLSILYIVLCITRIPNFWHGWKAFGQFLGDWLARGVLTIFYFTILIPFGIGVRLFSDPLHLKKDDQPFWRPRTTGDKNLQDVLRQF